MRLGSICTFTRGSTPTLLSSRVLWRHLVQIHVSDKKKKKLRHILTF
ncbi:hypothetical protein LEMLEM_LOCUS9779 [Lemmus lemmus]